MQTMQERADAVRKSGEVWWGGRHHEMTQPPMPRHLSPHLPAIFLLSGWGENGQSRVRQLDSIKVYNVPSSKVNSQRKGGAYAR
jgi:hypothetical protein